MFFTAIVHIYSIADEKQNTTLKLTDQTKTCSSMVQKRFNLFKENRYL